MTILYFSHSAIVLFFLIDFILPFDDQKVGNFSKWFCKTDGQFRIGRLRFGNPRSGKRRSSGGIAHEFVRILDKGFKRRALPESLYFKWQSTSLHRKLLRLKVIEAKLHRHASRKRDYISLLDPLFKPGFRRGQLEERVLCPPTFLCGLHERSETKKQIFELVIKKETLKPRINGPQSIRSPDFGSTFMFQVVSRLESRK